MNIVPKFDVQLKHKMIELFDSASRVLDLSLTFHDLTMAISLSNKWEIHHHPACLAIKAVRQQDCADYCGRQVRRSLRTGDGLLVETCPFSHGQISVLVSHRGLAAGVVYAAPYWDGEGEVEGMISHPGGAWVRDRVQVVKSVVQRVEYLMDRYDISDNLEKDDERRALIINTVHEHIQEGIKLEDMAKVLHLSVSRTGRLVKELFDCTYPQLILALKLQEATKRMRLDCVPLAQLSQDLGFSDQSHFNRSFKRAYGQTPRAWAKIYGVNL